MKDIVSKLSLYDILAMVIPGGTILMLSNIALSHSLFNISMTTGILFWLIYFIAAYIIGLIHHMFTSFVWSDFRNNERMVQDGFGLSQAEKQCLCSIIFKNLAYLLAYYFVLSVLRRILSVPILPCTHIESLICFVLSSVAIYVIYDNKNKEKREEQSDKISQYYSKYYYALKSRYSDDIPIMEGQVAFIQNMIIPMSIVFILPSAIYDPIQIMIALILPLLILTVFHIQKKIYRRVLDDYKYLHQCNEDCSCTLNVINNKKITIADSQFDAVMTSDNIKIKD